VLEDRLSGECSIANMVCDALRAHIHDSSYHESTRHLVVACDASGIQAGLRESAVLRVDDLYRILPYADSLYEAVVNPADLLSILASNVLRRLSPDSLSGRGGPVDPTDWARIARGFLHFSANLRYRAGPSGLREATLDGTPVSSLPEREGIRIICNSFSAMGNQGWGPEDVGAFEEFGSASLPAMGFEDRGEPLRQVLIASLSRTSAVDIVTDGRAIFDPR
ncbi:MAG: 5'-nucleotidase C-terminal domain-containing protein, partial [Spirochaetota bacterium]